MQPIPRPLFSFESDYAERQEREAQERVRVARENLPAQWDWAISRGFGEEINSSMIASLYAAGFRDAAWAGLEFFDGLAATQTCKGRGNALHLAASEGDFEFIERGESMAAERERLARLSASDAARPPLDEQGALQWARQKIWGSVHVWGSLMDSAIEAGDSPEGRRARDFWRERFTPERNYNGEVHEAFSRTAWANLHKTVLRMRDEETLAWIFEQEASATNAKGELMSAERSSRVAVLGAAWSEGWGKTVLDCLPDRLAFTPKDLDARANDQFMAISQSPSDAFPEQIKAVFERAKPGPRRLSSWLLSLVESCDYVSGNEEKEKDALSRARVLLDLGADPTLPRLGYWREEEPAADPADGFDQSAMHRVMMKFFEKSRRVSQTTRDFYGRLALTLAQAPCISRLDDKGAFGQPIGGVMRRRVSPLGMALASGQFELAQKLSDLGADWRSAKNLFDSPTMATDHPEAHAFFEAMQLRELAAKTSERARKRRAKNEPPAASAGENDPAPAPPSAPRRATRRL